MEDEQIDALREILEPGDLIEYRGVTPKLVFKVVDLLPGHIMWTNERGETSLISWKDFLEAKGWEEKNQPQLVKYYETEEYKRRSAEFDSMMKELEEEYKQDPKAFYEKCGLEYEPDDEN